MKVRTLFSFKAATGFGAIIDGCVAGTSEEHVKRDLIRQGLIPVRIWSERVETSLFDRFLVVVKHWVSRVRAAFFNAQLPFER